MRKPNISRWYLLGIAAILAVAGLVLSIGTATARYRASWEKGLLFEPRGSAMPVLGVMEEYGFDPEAEISWKVEPNQDAATLEFALGNLNGDLLPREETLRFRIRIIGSLSAWEEQAGARLILRDGTLREDGTIWETAAKVTPIQKGTALYRSFGDGWVFEFLDEQGTECTWTLPGGDYSTAAFSITLEGSGTSDVSLLQLQIISEVAG